MTIEEIAVELARESAAEQGLPEFIEDNETLLKVAAIIAPSEEAKRAS
jgi:hypothetical protein